MIQRRFLCRQLWMIGFVADLIMEKVHGSSALPNVTTSARYHAFITPL